MSDLKKSDLVMTEHGLGWYDDNLSGFPVLLNNGFTGSVSLLDSINDSSAVKEIAKATKEQVTEYIRGLGFVYYTNSYVYEKEGNQFEVAEFDTGEYRVSGNLDPKDFLTAPAMQSEAIQVAQLLNAVKD